MSAAFLGIFRDKWNRDIKLGPHDRLFAATLDKVIPRSVLPNHITVFRFFLTPFVIFFVATGDFAVGMPLFVFAALTDAVDGSLARVRRQITEWGILYDPLADKLLIGSVLFVIVLKYVNFTLGIALLLIEAAMIVGAWIRHRKGRIQPANTWGKIKMVTEVVGIALLLLALWLDVSILVDISAGTLAIALITAIVSVLSRLHA